MSIRPATHAGSWYSNNPTKLKNQLDQFFAKARSLKTPLVAKMPAMALMAQEYS